MGMIEQNNITVSIPSPVERLIDHLNASDGERFHSFWKQHRGLKAILNAAQEPSEVKNIPLQTPLTLLLQGSGYYRVTCCANHSCCPNASRSVDTFVSDHTLTLIAQRDIAPNEEITISYIDETEAYEQRSVALLDYGFVCDCPKCKRKD